MTEPTYTLTQAQWNDLSRASCQEQVQLILESLKPNTQEPVGSVDHYNVKWLVTPKAMEEIDGSFLYNHPALEYTGELPPRPIHQRESRQYIDGATSGAPLATKLYDEVTLEDYARTAIAGDRAKRLGQEAVAVVKENPYCPEGSSDELSTYLPVGTKLYTHPPVSTARREGCAAVSVVAQ